MNGTIPEHILCCMDSLEPMEYQYPDGQWLMCGRGIVVAGYDLPEVQQVFAEKWQQSMCSRPECHRIADLTLTGYDGPFCGPCHELAEQLTAILVGHTR